MDVLPTGFGAYVPLLDRLRQQLDGVDAVRTRPGPGFIFPSSSSVGNGIFGTTTRLPTLVHIGLRWFPIPLLQHPRTVTQDSPSKPQQPSTVLQQPTIHTITCISVASCNVKACSSPIISFSRSTRRSRLIVCSASSIDRNALCLPQRSQPRTRRNSFTASPDKTSSQVICYFAIR